MKNIAAVVLAAGRGTRLNSTTFNKVMQFIGKKPMIGYTIDILKKTGIKTIVVVVGFAKESIISYLKEKVLYAEQKEQLGTAKAGEIGLKKIPKNITNILSVYGDDSYCYPVKLLKELVKRHKKQKADLTMLIVEKENPKGLGRILRSKDNKIIGIVEHKNASTAQKKIKEINTGCYIFKRSFIEEYLPKIKKNKISGEYYLTDLVELAVKGNKKIEAVRGSKIPWRGVNTRDELTQARKIMTSIK